MSYDIRFGVKGHPDDRMYVVFEPEYSSPTYNIGTMLRVAMDWDFEQGEWYRVSDVLPNIERGIHELTYNRHEYDKYNPSNGWGSTETAYKALQNIVDTIHKYVVDGWDWNDYDIDHLWIRW